jgi:hypothetical protein
MTGIGPVAVRQPRVRDPGKPPAKVWPTTREQRCWVHKTANVLGKLPKSQQPKAKRPLQEIWMAETENFPHLVRLSSTSGPADHGAQVNSAGIGA